MGSIHLLYQEVERLRKCAVARKEFEDKAEQRLRDQEYEEERKEIKRDNRQLMWLIIGLSTVGGGVLIAAILTAIFGG